MKIMIKTTQLIALLALFTSQPVIAGRLDDFKNTATGTVSGRLNDLKKQATDTATAAQDQAKAAANSKTANLTKSATATGGTETASDKSDITAGKESNNGSDAGSDSIFTSFSKKMENFNKAGSEGALALKKKIFSNKEKAVSLPDESKTLGEKSPVRFYDSMLDNPARSAVARLRYEAIKGGIAIKLGYGPLVPKALRSFAQGWLTSGAEKKYTSPESAKDIIPFIQEFTIPMNECTKENPEDYAHFNDFFYRTLKKGARIIDDRSFIISSPADSKLRVISPLNKQAKFFVKQEPFDLYQFLLGKEDGPAVKDFYSGKGITDEQLEIFNKKYKTSLDAQNLQRFYEKQNNLVSKYDGGTFLNFRLAPTDYHRFHIPFDCTITKIVGDPINDNPKLIDATSEDNLQSVSPIAFREKYWPISTNKRVRLLLKSKEFGDVIMMIVGAAGTSSINLTAAKKLIDNTPVSFVKGEELGFFAFGGSTTCLLFQKGKVSIPDALIKRSTNPATIKDTLEEDETLSFETYVRVGQGIAVKIGQESRHLCSLDYASNLDPFQLKPGAKKGDIGYNTLYQKEGSSFVYQAFSTSDAFAAKDVPGASTNPSAPPQDTVNRDDGSQY